jgi:hypothetical protein
MMPELKELEITIPKQQGDQKFLMNKENAKLLAESFRIGSDVYERVCWLLLVDISFNFGVNGINLFSISDQIRYLESESNSGNHMKRATQFTRPPLHPLWHQHYFSAYFLPKNLREEFKRGKKGQKIIEKIFDPNKSEFVTEEMINEFVHQATLGLFEQRARESRTTGEWLIFAEHKGLKYYLCMATHTMDDQQIYERLKIICRMQFPFLEPFASDRSVDESFPPER